MTSSQESFARLWRAFMSLRVAIATALLGLQSFFYATLHDHSLSVLILCTLYWLASLATRIWAKPHPPGSTFDAQWVLTVGVDVFVFACLNLLQASGLSYTPLFTLPLLLASTLGPARLGLGTAASITLLLLVQAWSQSLQPGNDATQAFLQSGMSALGFFVMALLANQLAQRLAREELRAAQNQLSARMQTLVNQLIIENLADGVLVIDAQNTVQGINPAAKRLLTGQPHSLFIELVQQTFTHNASQTIQLTMPGSGQRLHARSRLATLAGDQASLCVVFLEDWREMEARMRTEKMAAMGRMSTAVAHEIRNPLAAIAQANALLQENLHAEKDLQLSAMIEQNAKRLARIVEELLNVARAEELALPPGSCGLALDGTVQTICQDWLTQNGSNCVQIKLAADTTQVAFDAEHLRRVLVNLLDNAQRYANKTENSIRVITSTHPPRVSVWSDGAELEDSVKTHLFEPFFSSESRSSGLGLYICRQLCERYSAVLDYRPCTLDGVQGNEFFILFTS